MLTRAKLTSTISPETFNSTCRLRNVARYFRGLCYQIHDMTTILKADLLSLQSVLNDLLELGTNAESQIDMKEISDSLARQIAYSPEKASHPFHGLKHIRESRYRMSGMLRTVHAMSGVLGEVFEPQVNTAAFHYGLQSVPDEVLSIILGHAVFKYKGAQDLSQVCARFRSIMLSSPRIWAGLGSDTSMTSHQSTTMQDRSRGMLFDADLDLKSGRYGIGRDILMHCSVLEELYVTWGNRDLVKPFQSLVLPNLRLLHMSNEPHDHLYRFWTMPLLQDLETDFIPSPAVSCNLVRCKIDVNYSRHDALLAFLASAPLLEDLCMVFSATDETLRTKSIPVALPNVKTMTLIINEYVSAKIVQRVLATLELENLSNLNLRFCLCRYRRLFNESRSECGYNSMVYDEYLNLGNAPLLSFIKDQQSLRHLDVCIGGQSCGKGEGYDERITFDPFNIFNQLFTDPPRNLQTLRIRKPGYAITIEWDVMQDYPMVPPILSLHILDGERLISEDLRRLLGNILNKQPEIRRVIVARCPQIDEDKLRTLFPDTEDISVVR